MSTGTDPLVSPFPSYVTLYVCDELDELDDDELELDELEEDELELDELDDDELELDDVEELELADDELEFDDEELELTDDELELLEDEEGSSSPSGGLHCNEKNRINAKIVKKVTAFPINFSFLKIIILYIVIV